jgi:hypothetical protein
MKRTFWSCVAAICLFATSAGAQYVTRGGIAPTGYGAARPAYVPVPYFYNLGYPSFDPFYSAYLRNIREDEALARLQIEGETAQAAEAAAVAAEAAAAAATKSKTPSVLPQTPGSIDAKKDSHGQVLIHWQGRPETVNKITFALLNSKKKAIQSKVVTRLPAEARFKKTRSAAYYRATVEYVNGSKNVVTSAL